MIEMRRTVKPAPLTYFMVNPRPVSQYCDIMCARESVCVHQYMIVTYIKIADSFHQGLMPLMPVLFHLPPL